MLLCSGSICTSKRIAYLFIFQHGQILIATDDITDQLSVTNSDGMEYKNLKTYGIHKSTVLKKIKNIISYALVRFNGILQQLLVHWVKNVL